MGRQRCESAFAHGLPRDITVSPHRARAHDAHVCDERARLAMADLRSPIVLGVDPACVRYRAQQKTGTALALIALASRPAERSAIDP